jgi:enamine deaminase RidA (YjgF/YER057c/UK114 family)
MKTIVPKALGAPLGMYSHGVVVPAGELVVVAGQVGTGPGGVASGDVVAQTKQAFQNVRLVLEAAGCTLRDVVRFQTFLTRADDIPGFMKARQELFEDAYPDRTYPPNTLLVISRLVRPELLVEIEAMAVRHTRARAAKAKVARPHAARKARKRAGAPVRKGRNARA